MYNLTTPHKALAFADIELSWENDFIAHLPEEEKGKWNCIACKTTFNRYGNVVTIDRTDAGIKIQSALWVIKPDTAYELRNAFKHLQDKMLTAETFSPFYKPSNKADEKAFRIGVAERGGYPHFHFDIDSAMVEVSSLEQAGAVQFNCEKTLSSLVGQLDTIRLAHKHLHGLGESYKSDIVKRKIDKLAFIISLLTMIKEKKISVKNAVLSLSKYERDVIYTYPGSVEARYVSDFNTDNAAKKVKVFLNDVDSINYMRAEREASDANLQNLKKFLIEENITDAFNWKYAELSDLTLVHHSKHTNQNLPEVFAKVHTETKVEPIGNSAALDVIGKRLSGAAETKSVASVAVTKTVDSVKFYTEIFPQLINPCVLLDSISEIKKFTFHQNSRVFIGHPFKCTGGNQEKYLADGVINNNGVEWLAINGGTSFMKEWFVGHNVSRVPVVGSISVLAGHTMVLMMQARDVLCEMRPPIFAETYKNSFHPHRRAMETLITGEDALHVTVPENTIIPVAVALIKRIDVVGELNGVVTLFQVCIMD